MRARMFLLASIVGLGLLDGHYSARAGDPRSEPRNIIGVELTAIHQCVRRVRQSTPGSDFDAHVGTQGDMRYEGTDAEIAEFKRCMEAKGFPIDRH